MSYQKIPKGPFHAQDEIIRSYGSSELSESWGRKVETVITTRL